MLFRNGAHTKTGFGFWRVLSSLPGGEGGDVKQVHVARF